MLVCDGNMKKNIRIWNANIWDDENMNPQASQSHTWLYQLYHSMLPTSSLSASGWGNGFVACNGGPFVVIFAGVMGWVLLHQPSQRQTRWIKCQSLSIANPFPHVYFQVQGARAVVPSIQANSRKAAGLAHERWNPPITENYLPWPYLIQKRIKKEALITGQLWMERSILPAAKIHSRNWWHFAVIFFPLRGMVKNQVWNEEIIVSNNIAFVITILHAPLGAISIHVIMSLLWTCIDAWRSRQTPV